ncbi:protein kinase [Planotetraspora thailandica]|uniref:serine/threonine-protein kinase n=1 Tax=Planotetraspora thailandica TaxID=487172 RepID=UPI001EF1BD54|nr:serine/threonine-protein kinase [Planotetraspora thailandica]
MSTERTIICGRYELDALPIGQGGMGAVYAGYDQKLDRRVAVKLIRFPLGVQDEALEQRFRHEARIMAKLEHPGTPAIYDADVYEDAGGVLRPFMVMQYIEGATVDDIVAEHGPLPVPWAVAIAAQVAAVLQAAHHRGVFHRDLKPSNLMLGSDGGVKVLDFGLAMFHDPELAKLTRTGTVLGTPAYMSPEQIRAATVGPQSDFYALGLVLHEILTGRRLFDGPTEFAIFERQVNEAPRSIREVRPDVPEELDRVVLRLLAKRAEDRPAHAEEIYSALVAFAPRLVPMPGYVTPTLSSLRMYAGVIGRIIDDVPSPVSPVSAPEPPQPHDVEFSRGDIARARDEAASLAGQSRYGQAIEVLSAVVAPASRVLGRVDDDVTALRLHLAEVLFEGNDYRRAATVFGELYRDLAIRYGPRDERVLHCRRQEATCQALLGETTEALAGLRRLLDDEEDLYGSLDPRPLELRRQIGLLELGMGDTGRARETLSGLLEDLTRVYGAEHQEASRVRASLSRLSM